MSENTKIARRSNYDLVGEAKSRCARIFEMLGVSEDVFWKQRLEGGYMVEADLNGNRKLKATIFTNGQLDITIHQRNNYILLYTGKCC